MIVKGENNDDDDDRCNGNQINQWPERGGCNGNQNITITSQESKSIKGFTKPKEYRIYLALND